jgi:hypothetical protein
MGLPETNNAHLKLCCGLAVRSYTLLKSFYTFNILKGIILAFSILAKLYPLAAVMLSVVLFGRLLTRQQDVSRCFADSEGSQIKEYSPVPNCRGGGILQNLDFLGSILDF